MAIVYQELPAQDASAARCSAMGNNQMQCPERATYKLEEPFMDEKLSVFLCKHHMVLMQHDNNAHGVEIKPALDTQKSTGVA